MIETAGVDRDHIPTVKRIEAVPRAHKRRDVGPGVEQRAKDRSKPIIQNGGERQNRQPQDKQQYRSFFHMIRFSVAVFTSNSSMQR
jgi:hypothetical protein